MRLFELELPIDLPQSTFATSSYTPASSIHESTLTHTSSNNGWQSHQISAPSSVIMDTPDGNSTSRGILIGLLSAFGSAGFAVLILALFFFFKYTAKGRILLDRIGRPGEYDDEQAFAREEADALENMDDMQKADYLRAKGMISPLS